jgi:hypothetical protein
MAALLPIFAVSAYELSQDPALINGELDDAPQRAFGVLLVMLPVIYVVLALMAHGLGALFIRFGLRTMRSFLLGSVLLGVLLSVPFALGRPDVGVEDRLISFLVLGVAFSIIAIPGAACWFLIARRSQQPDAAAGGESAV